MDLIRRKKESEYLIEKYKSDQAEFIALYGRRRVGKTYLVSQLFRKKGIYFECTGQKDAALAVQLKNFVFSLTEAFNLDIPVQVPSTWSDALKILTVLMKKYPSKRITLFFDEFPWLASRKSGLIQALDYYWNRFWSRMPYVFLIVCGSASAWILNNLINAKGGLHNRLTGTLHLYPFSLVDVKKYLEARGFAWKPMHIIDTYMVVGGIPYYLNNLDRRLSPVQNINRLCFNADGLLFNEYDRLIASLFDHDEIHKKILAAIAKKKEGISREELISVSGQKSGGTFKKRLDELEASGFIETFVPFGNKIKEFFIKIVDEYTLFYLHWINEIKSKKGLCNSGNYWLNMTKQNKWKIWAGNAFEALCYKHIDLILSSLGLQNLVLEVGGWRKKAKPGGGIKDLPGAQVDLIVDRTDKSITLCEIKYSDRPFLIDKEYARLLMRKIEIFRESVKTDKEIYLSFITSNGLKRNVWSEELVSSEMNFIRLLQ